MKRLKKKLKRQRAKAEGFKAERDAARLELAAALPEQVKQVALAGSIDQLTSAVLQPVRLNWPCGASIYQGQTFWDLSVDLCGF